MHPNPVYRQTPDIKNITFARERSFGVLSLNADPAPLVSHIPFQLSEDGSYLEAHLVRSNPILALLDEPREAVIAVSGGDAYISPDWYWIENQVPTWNYVAVHLRGTLKKLPTSDLRGVLDRLSASMEARLLPKKPWTIDKMDNRAFEKMAIQIVPIAMEISDIRGTWKLSQNKPAEAIEGAALGVKQSGIGQETSKLSELMTAPGE
jgi:transcriptional regulator